MRTINDIIHMDVWHRKCWGFTGGDNQGIIGLEVQYEKYLKGTDGKILTLTDAAGIELENEAGGSHRAGGRAGSAGESGCNIQM